MGLFKTKGAPWHTVSLLEALAAWHMMQSLQNSLLPLPGVQRGCHEAITRVIQSLEHLTVAHDLDLSLLGLLAVLCCSQISLGACISQLHTMWSTLSCLRYQCVQNPVPPKCGSQKMVEDLVGALLRERCCSWHMSACALQQHSERGGCPII